jgi:hypothetical protein
LAAHFGRVTFSDDSLLASGDRWLSREKKEYRCSD